MNMRSSCGHCRTRKYIGPRHCAFWSGCAMSVADLSAGRHMAGLPTASHPRHPHRSFRLGPLTKFRLAWRRRQPTASGRIRPSPCAVRPNSIALLHGPLAGCRSSTIPSATKPSPTEPPKLPSKPISIVPLGTKRASQVTSIRSIGQRHI